MSSLHRPIRGIMIDASRLVEQPSFYHRLVEYMGRWGLNTLLFHFSDDHGCAVELPGYEYLAMRHALSANDVADLLDHARRCGIEVIPELETFGHTRFITDHPRHRHLSSRQETDELVFGAVDPEHPETHELLKGLIESTATLFGGSLLHVGCDEVDLDDYCRARSLDPGAVWVRYVNRMFAYCRNIGRRPMFWADHPGNDPRLGVELDKDAVAVSWDYRPRVTDTKIRHLRKLGFRDILSAPATSCHAVRFLPTTGTLENVRRNARFVEKYDLGGMISTIWFPQRYPQGSVYYGVAYAAEAMDRGGSVRRKAFRERFASETFGVEADRDWNRFLGDWPKLDVPISFFWSWLHKGENLTETDAAQLQQVNNLGPSLLELGESLQPRENENIWKDMLLAGWCAWICSEAWVLSTRRTGHARREAYTHRLEQLRRDIHKSWKLGRFADDPRRKKPAFRGREVDYVPIILTMLPTF